LSPSSSPVFVHSGWRCSSTYVWQKFRAVPQALAFYEPWHEQLARLTAETIELERPDNSGLRHPGENQPYLSEFRDLLHGSEGVVGYESRFALDGYFLEPDAEDPQQAAYIGNLITTAHRRSRTPVLACCRTLGRIGWLRRRFGGTHIVLIRDPVQQWRSFYSLRKRPRPTYFEQCQYVILSEVAQAATASRRLGLTPGAGDLAMRIKAARDRFKRAPARVSFAAFVAVYVLSYLSALPQADLVIDVDRLGVEPDYARAMADRIAALTGLAVDFSDCRAPRRHVEPAAVSYREEALAMINALGAGAALRAKGATQVLYAKLLTALPEPVVKPSVWRRMLERPRLAWRAQFGGAEA
jgi:hypothetical protein